MIADSVSLAVANLYEYRENAYKNGESRETLDYNLCLQAHDAIMAIVKYEHVARYIDEVLPTCLKTGVPIYPCSLDGMPTGAGPFYLGFDYDVFFNWYITPMPDTLKAVGINPKYSHWHEVTKIIDGQEVIGYTNEEKFSKKIFINGKLIEV